MPAETGGEFSLDLIEECQTVLYTEDVDQCKRMCTEDENCVAIDTDQVGRPGTRGRCALWNCKPGRVIPNANNRRCFWKMNGKSETVSKQYFYIAFRAYL